MNVTEILTPHKLGRPVLSASLHAGDFDCLGVDCAFPFKHGDGYLMTYTGWDGRGYRTGLASSKDLITWRKEGLILDRGAAGSITEHNVSLTSILRENALFSPGMLRKIDGRFVGTYHAYPEPGYEQGSAVIGLCYSTDLCEWTIEDPVLVADKGSAWEAGGLYKSWVMEHDGTFYLFYNAKTKGSESEWIEQTGVATSSDLKSWRRHPGNPLLCVGKRGQFDDRFASDPCVLKHNDTWLMFYFGNCTDGHARAGVAFSKDLVSWEKSPRVLIDVGAPGEIDSIHAHKSGLISPDGKSLFHYYTAVSPVEPTTIDGVTILRSRSITLATNRVIKQTA